MMDITVLPYIVLGLTIGLTIGNYLGNKEGFKWGKSIGRMERHIEFLDEELKERKP